MNRAPTWLGAMNGTPTWGGPKGLRLIDLESADKMSAPLLLLRKEVIQPHLPIRLPCYDLVPITGTTFGNCLPCGLAS